MEISRDSCRFLFLLHFQEIRSVHVASLPSCFSFCLVSLWRIKSQSLGERACKDKQ